MAGKNQFYMFCMHGGDSTNKHSGCPAKIYIKGLNGSKDNGLKVEDIVNQHKGHYKYCLTRSQQPAENIRCATAPQRQGVRAFSKRTQPRRSLLKTLDRISSARVFILLLINSCY